MKVLIEHLIVVLIAIVMAFVGYWLMGRYAGGRQPFIEWHDIGWTVWSSTVSALTWLILYRICRNIHWLALPVMGLFSPLIGSILFFPFTPFVWELIGKFALVVFPVAMATGFLISVATLPFRPRWVRTDRI